MTLDLGRKGRQGTADEAGHPIGMMARPPAPDHLQPTAQLGFPPPVSIADHQFRDLSIRDDQHRIVPDFLHRDLDFLVVSLDPGGFAGHQGFVVDQNHAVILGS